MSCPGPNHAQGDRDPSLHVSTGRNGGCTLKCFAGCDPRDIVDALGLTMADLFVPDPSWRPSGVAAPVDLAWLAAEYNYVDTNGVLRYQVQRVEHLTGPKTFTQRRPNGSSWIRNLEGVERIVYRLPELRRAIDAGRAVWYVEGEKDAETLRRRGLIATTAGSVNNWRDDMAQSFAGARAVTIVADRDAPGFEHARRVAAAIDELGVPTRVVVAPERKDVTEHLELGGVLGDLVPLESDAVPAVEIVSLEGLRLGGYVDWPEAFRSEQDAEARWLVQPILAVGRSHALYAGAKTGKSLLMLAAAAALATGKSFLDRPAGVPVPVLYCDYEMTRDDVLERLDTFGYYDPAELERLHYALLSQGAGLDTEAGGSEVVHDAAALGVGLVVIDTTARAVAGAENESDTLRNFARWTGSPLKRLGITVVRIDHAGKDPLKGQRGTSAKNDDVDLVWRLTVGSSEGAYDLEATHSRMGWVERGVKLRLVDRIGVDGMEWTADRATSLGDNWMPGVGAKADELDAAKVPIDAPRRVAISMLREATGSAGSNELVAQAMRFRKNRLGL